MLLRTEQQLFLIRCSQIAGTARVWRVSLWIRGRAMPVRIEQKDHVTTVIIDRIDARNAVDEPTAEALMQAFVGFEADPDARAAVLWGAGGTFCAGYDLKYASTLADPNTFRREFIDKLPFPTEGTPVRGPMGPSRLLLSKPVIAAVEGASVAGGMELALWCATSGSWPTMPSSGSTAGVGASR
jgi:enoyl-CoA hydratase/carnithine racemase